MNLEEARYYFNNQIGSTEATKMLVIIAQNQTLKGMKFIQELTNCSDDDAQQLWCELSEQYGTKENNPAISDLTPQQIAQANAQAQELLNTPHCPTCGSTNIKKIGGIERGASIAAFGIFSKKINKTFKCGNCGYTW